MKYYLTLTLWLILLIAIVTLTLFWNIGSLNDAFNMNILLNVRIPRLGEALLTGAILTLTGLMFQTVLNNPLADSFTLGLASGATLGSGIALVLGLSILWLPIFSIIFSLLTLIIVLTITAMMSNGYPVRILILVGLMIGALFNALLYFLVLLKPQKLNNIANYLFGGFGAAEYRYVVIIGITFIIGLLILTLMLNRIKLMQLGELKGQSLGLNVQSLTFIVLGIASIMTAVNVAFVGIIGFIGMVIPQLIRHYYWKYTLGAQICLNIIIGAIMMACADFVGGILMDPIQIPASIMIAIIGIPLLFYILIKQSKLLH